jgi:hypothetical protein
MAVHFLTDDSKTFFDDPEKLLFRVMPLDRVIEVVEKNRWAFVSPTLWNDPFEKAFLEAEYKHQGKAFFLPLKPKKVSSELQYSLFSVCFTATRESEAFWKTYSPNGDGIRLTVKATVLKTALAKLYRFQKDVKFWKELQSQTINETHLKLMLKKRLPFEYENEIRIMLLRKTPMTKSVAKVSLTKANELISGIKLNPRMGTYMARMVKEIFCAKGFTADVVRKSRLYSKPESTITFKEDIDKGYEIY